MKLKWYGTATIQIEHEGAQLLFDPFLSLNEKAFKPNIDDLAAVGNILITHGHLDHASDVPAILKHCDGKAVVYCTNKPYEVLRSKGVGEKSLRIIAPGDVLGFGPFEVRVLKGKHIIYDRWLLARKLLSPRNLIYLSNLRYMLEENKICTESGETVIYDIVASNRRILLLGSLNLDENTEYPTGADLMVLPFQGRSDIGRYAMPFIGRLKPRRVLLDHFDDSFPPLTCPVRTSRFIARMNKAYPDVPVICPQASDRWMSEEDLLL